MQDQQHQASIYSMNPGSRGVPSAVMEDRSTQMPVPHPEDSTSPHNGPMPPHRSHFDGHSTHLANSHHYAMMETSPRAPHANPTYFYDSSFTSLPDPRLAHPLSMTYQDHTGVSSRQDPSRAGHAMNVDEEFRFFSQDPQSTIPASQTPNTQPISGRTRNKEMRGVGNHAAERATTAKDEEEVFPPRKGPGASRTVKGSSASAAEKVRGRVNTYHQAGRPDPVDAISTIELNQGLVFSGQPKNGPMHHMPALGHTPMHHIPNSGSQAISSPSASTTMGHTVPQRTPNNGINFVVKSLAGKAPVHPVDLPGSELSPHTLQQLRQQQMLQHQQLHAQQSFLFASESHSIPPTSSNPISTSDAHSRLTSQQRHPLSASTPALTARSLPSPASTSQIPSHSSSYSTFPASSDYHNPNYGGNSSMGGTSARTDPGISTLVLSDSSGSNTTAHMTSPLPNVSISTPRQYPHEMQRGIAQPQQSFQQQPHFAPYHAPSQMPYQPRQQPHNQFQAQHYQRHHAPQATSTRSLSASSPSIGTSASQNHYNTSAPSQETVLWVNYLPLQWNEETIKSELQALLEIHGAPNARVLNVALHPQLATESLNRTLATITLPTKEDCETAMQILRHCKVQGKILSISFQQPVRPLESEESLATTKTLFVANVHLSVTEEQIRLLFMQFGEVVSAVVVKNQNSNQSRGFVFVEYAEHASCELALRFLQNENFCGQPLKLKLAKAQTQTPTQLALPQKTRADSGSPRGAGGSASTPTTPTAPYPSSSSSSSASSTFSPSTSPMAHSQTHTTSNPEQPTSEKFKLLEPQQRKVVFTVGRKRASSSSSSSPAVNASSSPNAHSNLSSGAGSESPMSNVSPISSPSPSSTPRSTPRFQEPHHAVPAPSTADRRRLSLPTRPAAPGTAATPHPSASHDQQARATVPTIWYSSGDGMIEDDSHMGTN